MADEAIRKRTDLVIKTEKNLSKAKEQIKSNCTHTKHGEPTFVAYNGPREDGKLRYICKQCQKEVEITTMTEAEIEAAIHTIDKAIDIIKITAGNVDKDSEDAKIMTRMMKMQYRLRNDLLPTFRAANKKANRSNNKHNQNNNNYESTWGRPSTER